MARTDPQFNVRMPAELKEQLTELASINHRSINAEIIAAIQAWIESHNSKLPQKDPFRGMPPLDIEGSWKAHKEQQAALDFAIRTLTDLRDEQTKNTPLETLKKNRPSRKEK